jgi:hypothetical protein
MFMMAVITLPNDAGQRIVLWPSLPYQTARVSGLSVEGCQIFASSTVLSYSKGAGYRGDSDVILCYWVLRSTLDGDT